MRRIALLLSMVLLAIAVLQRSAFPDEPKPPREFSNSLGMKLVLVPAGEFTMGSDESPEERAKSYPQYEAERFAEPDSTPHRVRITKPFFLSAHEVTRDAFRQFVEKSGRNSDAETDGTGGYGHEPNRPTTLDAFAGRDPKYNWRNPGFEQQDNHPVVNVTWNDAVAFCEWLSKQEGKHYRLPTEAEWEYACRAGSQTRYHSGNDPASLLTVANLYDADTKTNYPQWEKYSLPGHDGHPFTAPVGSFKPNAFGLYDMHGNVWEWCSDWYGEDYYRNSPADDPAGPATGKVRVRRGGSWHSWAYYVRACYRNFNTPATRYTLVGFRVACDAN